MKGRLNTGQAMVETIVSVAFLAPLFIGAWYIASLQSLTLSSLGGARHGFLTLYAADREVALPDLRALVTAENPGIDLSFRASFIFSDEASMPSAQRVQAITKSLLGPVQALSTESFDVSDAIPRRLTAHLWIDPAEWSGLEALVPTLQVQAPVAVLLGVAGSSGRIETLDRVRALSASRPFETLTRPVRLLRPALEILEPAFRLFCPGRLEPDILPVDRLPTVGIVDNDLRVRSCD